MEKPPTTSTQAQRDAKKKQIEEAKKMKEREKDMLIKFRQQVCIAGVECYNIGQLSHVKLMPAG